MIKLNETNKGTWLAARTTRRFWFVNLRWIQLLSAITRIKNSSFTDFVCISSRLRCDSEATSIQFRKDLQIYGQIYSSCIELHLFVSSGWYEHSGCSYHPESMPTLSKSWLKDSESPKNDCWRHSGMHSRNLIWICIHIQPQSISLLLTRLMCYISCFRNTITMLTRREEFNKRCELTEVSILT